MMESSGSWSITGSSNHFEVPRRAWHKPAMWSLLVALLLDGCSFGPQKPVTETDTMLSRLQNYQHGHDEFSRLQLESALQYFQGLDQQVYQWQSLFALANWYVANDQQEPALDYARRAYQLVRAANSRLGNEESFQSNLQMGQLVEEGENVYFQQALKVAGSPLQQALVYALSDDYASLKIILPAIKSGQSEQLAFLYYQLGKHEQDVPTLEQARSYYALAEDSRGVTDSLFMMARILLTDSPAAASATGQRALVAAVGAGDQQRQQVIRQWLEHHFPGKSLPAHSLSAKGAP